MPMAPRIRSMNSYPTHQEYYVDFFGDELIVTVTSVSFVISRWISDFAFNMAKPWYQPLLVGVGVQWTPAHYCSDSPPGNHYADSPVDTLQLCVGERCIIIRLSHCDRVPDDLHDFLEDDETRFVGIWNSQDARKLEESRHQLVIEDLLDLRKYVEDSEGRSLKSCSFEVIVEECLGYRGVRLDREVSMSNWRVDNLCHDQILQASIDAYVCCRVGVRHRLWEEL